MAITAFQTIQCDAVPTADNDLTNKKYVDEAVASAGGGGGGGGSSDRLTTNTQGVYAIGPPNIGQSTYLVPQTTIAAEYNAATTYQIGDICTYQGELWRRQFQAGSGVAPNSVGMLWQKITLISAVGGAGGGGYDKTTATVNGGNGTVDMTSKPEVIIDTCPYFLGTIGLILTNGSLSGMLSVEVHIVYTTAGTRSSFLVGAGGSPREVVWVRGGLSDMSTAGTHIVRLRKFASGEDIYAEYVGKY
jgi:hypothetical protein